MSIERNMVSDLIDCEINEFVAFMRNVDLTTLLGVRNVLRNNYSQAELAFKDLEKLIEDQKGYSSSEGKLFSDLSFLLMNIEEKTRLLTEEIYNLTGNANSDMI